MQPPKSNIRPYQPSGTRKAPPGGSARTSGPSPSRMPAKKGEAWILGRKRVQSGHIALLAAILFVFGISMAVNSARIRSMEAQLETVRLEARAVMDEAAEKQRQLNFSATDAFIEQQAREKFGYIKEGETRFLPEAVIGK